MKARMSLLGSAAEVAGPVPTERSESLTGEIDVSVVVPCLNEVESVSKCVHEAQILYWGAIMAGVIEAEDPR
jgi:hypothetical protein